MEITTSTGVRGTALSGGPPTKAAGDGPPPLTGKTPAEALSASGEKPSAGDRPPRAAAAGAAVALLRSGEDGSISQEDAESLFKYLVDNKLAEKAEAFYGNYFVTPVLLHLAELIEEHGAVDNSIYSATGGDSGSRSRRAKIWPRFSCQIGNSSENTLSVRRRTVHPGAY